MAIYRNVCVLFLSALSVYASTNCDPESATSEHNTLRGLHVNTTPLSWDDDIASEAQRHAELLKTKNIQDPRTGLFHDHDLAERGMSENLYSITYSKQLVKVCERAVYKWYEEEKHSDYRTGQSTNEQSVNHFHLIVWMTASRFGMGMTSLTDAYGNVLSFVVARYVTVNGAATDNVMPRKFGAHTPAESVFIGCLNDMGDATCSQYVSYYGCNSYNLKENCANVCNVCS